MSRALSVEIERRVWRGRMIAMGVGVLSAVWFIWSAIDFGITPQRLLEAGERLLQFAGAAMPPSPGPFLEPILLALAETIAMAFLGTMAAAVIGLPLGVLAARNVLTFKPLHFAYRRVLDVFRTIPAIIWAFIFVRAVGLGPMAGWLAIAMSDFAALAKLHGEAIENVDGKAGEGIRSTGAGRVITLRYGILPASLPLYLAQVLYFFESNIRSAAILGIVGAGGIGFQLSERVRDYMWDQVAFIIILFLVIAAVLDTASRSLRRRLMRGA